MKGKAFKMGGAALVALMIAAAIFARSQNLAPISLAYNAIAQPAFSDVALGGYDPVAYFTEAKAVRGDSAYQFRWQDADWYFASSEHRDQFASAPEKYAPAYGGYCAFAVSQGIVAGADPEIWKIVDGRLFVNNNPDAAENWEKDISGNIATGDANWASR